MFFGLTAKLNLKTKPVENVVTSVELETGTQVTVNGPV